VKAPRESFHQKLNLLRQQPSYKSWREIILTIS
jgi:hypothetical protein